MHPDFNPEIDPYIIRTVGKTIADYSLIEEGDRILVALSGGKDSWALLFILRHFQKVSPVHFDLFPVTIHPGFKDFNTDVVENVLSKLNLSFHVAKTSIADTIRKRNTPGKNPCAFCARLRRGALYRVGKENNCTKIALGHHADDAIETLLISSAYEGRFVSLPPRLPVSQDTLILIRPMIRVWENDLETFFRTLRIPVATCSHYNAATGTRQTAKEILEKLSDTHPQLKKNLLAALQNIKPNHFLDPLWL
jgi:tRNA 2-thiocytidine biosynthesis protein TtcA